MYHDLESVILTLLEYFHPASAHPNLLTWRIPSPAETHWVARVSLTQGEIGQSEGIRSPIVPIQFVQQLQSNVG